MASAPISVLRPLSSVFRNDGAIAQLGERLPCTQEVRSSILLGSTIQKTDGRRQKAGSRRPGTESRWPGPGVSKRTTQTGLTDSAANSITFPSGRKAAQETLSNCWAKPNNRSLTTWKPVPNKREATCVWRERACGRKPARAVLKRKREKSQLAAWPPMACRSLAPTAKGSSLKSRWGEGLGRPIGVIGSSEQAHTVDA
jgi:hypothetical protein